MNKKIEFEDDNGKKYTLEYNREAIEVMERQGFVASEMVKKPMTMLPLAFQGLFYKNHKDVRKSFIDECYDRFPNKMELIEVIADMINQTYSELTDEEAKNKKGNLTWKIVG